MFRIIKNLFIFLFINEYIFIPILDEDYNLNFNFSFIILFVVSFYLNYTLNIIDQNLKLDFDLISKFFVLMFRTPNFLLNYCINIIKKIFLYLFYFKYRNSINYLKLTYKSLFKSSFVLWRPLFKKTSYFGFFRSNRSKWIK